MYMQILKTRGIRLKTGDYKEGVLPDATSSPFSTQPDGMPALVRVSHGENPDLDPVKVTRTRLEAVIFVDGHFVGPDSGHSFELMANRLNAEQELAGLVSAARNDPTKRDAWAAVYRIFNGRLAISRADRLKLALAADLQEAKTRKGDEAAYDVADRELSIPKLWRATAMSVRLRVALVAMRMVDISELCGEADEHFGIVME
jgi:hypothetical protein